MLAIYDYKTNSTVAPPCDLLWMQTLAKRLISLQYNTAFYQYNSAPGGEDALLGL